ncbi:MULTISPECIES: hypothetical protein [Streptosporangium]|uniref:DUF2199 domain-containing protein n=1 Tax=Streptosporangium brasiliense TaxID=47480 RepID=A0ABT9RIB5_9ACTN|nr:hypothetical protein [Streptosporangium brasiliense]MDP9868980.1 hypothetical protein [Streptosporangium brasiliense]
MTTEPHRLSLRVVVPPLGTRAGVECRPIVDGRDILTDVFDEGPAEDPRYLLGPNAPLKNATDVPREVRLAEAGCTERCCGAVYVTVRRQGQYVIWSGWRNPDAEEFDLPEFRFDVDQYAAEVHRATTDHSWEWPARTVARLLEERLREHTDWLTTWDCELYAVSAWPWEPEQITIFLFHPGWSAIGENRPWLQFRMTIPISGDDPADQVEHLEARLTAEDPREVAEVCGGSKESADQLGYPRPGPRRRA